MTLTDLASIGSFVSALAVLASLIYLALQIRQAERNQLASIRTARATRTVDLFMGLTAPDVATAVSKALGGADDITDTQAFQFINYGLARFINAEDAYYQHREGALNAYYFAGVANGMRLSFASPGMRSLWRRQRNLFGPEFVTFADEILAATPMVRDANGAAQFKADLAAELAGPAPAAGGEDAP